MRDICLVYFKSYCMWCIEFHISIMLIYTFYQPVFYATHDQHFPSESEERAAYWVRFGEHCGDAMTHKLLDKITQKNIYRSAVRPLTKSNPNHRHTEDGGEASTSKQPSSKIQTVFIRSRQDDDDPSHIKPMPQFDPEDLIGRTFLLPPQENGERLRYKGTKKVVEGIGAPDGNRTPISILYLILVKVTSRNISLITSYWTI